MHTYSVQYNYCVHLMQNHYIQLPRPATNFLSTTSLYNCYVQILCMHTPPFLHHRPTSCRKKRWKCPQERTLFQFLRFLRIPAGKNHSVVTRYRRTLFLARFKSAFGFKIPNGCTDQMLKRVSAHGTKLHGGYSMHPVPFASRT